MEEIKTIEAKVLQFYDQIYQIQLLQDFNDGVPSMSMENRKMVDEEITVGFDDEALTMKELLAGGKKQLQMISIVGMPGLELGICGQLFSDSGNWMFLNLEFLRHLETLKLCSNIFPRYPTTLREVKFPANIKRLTLKYTGLEWEEISVLGMMLPNLELLKLENNAAWGQQWATTDGGFPRLKFLKLNGLNVERWITCSDHFPSLQQLSLEWCKDLKEIPSSLGDILSLQLIEVKYCHSTVDESVGKIKEEQESNGNNWLKVLITKVDCDGSGGASAEEGLGGRSGGFKMVVIACSDGKRWCAWCR
ncbi:hypothetical protein LOK49_LG11G00378 [Camellia lanceoleosa]|uniref:Uncharacterized protein n=1 Tax=Camellia lanceoleosa TaxID=1840588 RepID=A0ACC0G137_9ERIC|nr:hypothetical protein LOK49_LG11G00378 [Camellia lanceoleosa]